MRTVLYTHDLEPITVLELGEWQENFLKEHKNIRIPLERKMSCEVHTRPPCVVEINSVDITAEELIRRGKRHLFLFADDEESALLLKSVFLPGQRKELQEHERQAMAQGMLIALSRICNNRGYD